MGKMWIKTCGFMLKAMGWTADTGAAPEDKAILIGVPHTSMMDFVVSYFFYTSTGKTAHVMIKDSMFKWPLGPVLRAAGAVPMERNNPTASIKKILDSMKDGQTFHLAMCPEGTRKPVKRWKTGYHLIAKEIGCPVYLAYFDWGTKHIGIGRKFELTDDAKADTERMQKEYSKMNLTGRHPEKYTTGY